MYWEVYFSDLVKGKRQGFGASLLRSLLFVLSWPYKGGVALRNLAYDKGWFRRYSPPVPVVVSIGNIVSGGAGKTPVTMMLARKISEHHRISILSRGYRSQAEKLSSPVLLHRDEGILHSPSYAGDEPFMLAQNLPHVSVYVGRNRFKAANLAAKAGSLALILDDGMQHRQINRDFEIVVLDSDDPFGQGHFLPRGFLRENPGSLARADLIVVTYVSDNEHLQSILAKIQKYSSAPVAAMKMKIDSGYDLNGSRIGSIKGKRVGAFCGIAKPNRFYERVERMGGEIIARKSFPDHLGFDPVGLQNFATRCQAMDAEMLICTEKDKVKLVDIPDLPIPVVWLRMEFDFFSGQSHWDEALGKILHLIERRQ